MFVAVFVIRERMSVWMWRCLNSVICFVRFECWNGMASVCQAVGKRCSFCCFLE